MLLDASFRDLFSSSPLVMDGEAAKAFPNAKRWKREKENLKMVRFLRQLSLEVDNRISDEEWGELEKLYEKKYL